jgi:ubiquinone/menaquinone biosynthesis C-methylase UbiE
MVRIAEDRSEGMEDVCFMTADATDLPFEDESFDLVLSFGILHHISAWPTVIDEVSRLLRPGGDYVLGDFCYSGFSSRLLRPIVRNYGVYTVDGILERARTSGMEVAWRGLPRGTFFRYQAMVLRKE